MRLGLRGLGDLDRFWRCLFGYRLLLIFWDGCVSFLLFCCVMGVNEADLFWTVLPEWMLGGEKKKCTCGSKENGKHSFTLEASLLH